MVEAFRALGITSDAWITRIEPVGAQGRGCPMTRTSMKFVSTRGGADAGDARATRSCKASPPDGGLFVPERLPAVVAAGLPAVGRAAGDRRAR